MRRMLVSAVLFTLAAAPFAPAAHADCPTPGSIDPLIIPELTGSTPGSSTSTCVNLGPGGTLYVGNLTSARILNPTYGTGAGTSATVCHGLVGGCTHVQHVGVGWHAPAGDIVSVGANGARVDAGSVTVWPAKSVGEKVDLCVTTNQGHPDYAC